MKRSIFIKILSVVLLACIALFVSVGCSGDNPSNLEVELSYSVSNGSILVNGTAEGSTYVCKVNKGENGPTVSIEPNDGYRFVKWSDGVLTNERQDKNVQENVSVSAECEEVVVPVCDHKNFSVGDECLICGGECYEKIGTDVLMRNLQSGSITAEYYGETATRTFADYKNEITNMIISDSVIAIGEDAFNSYKNLESVEIGKNVTTMETGAFVFCYKLNKVYYKGTIEQWVQISFKGACNPLQNHADLYIDNQLVTEITIDNVSKIPIQSFQGCTSLKSITVSGNVKIIGSDAFSECKGLESVTILDGIECIEAQAFYGCESIKNLTLPSSLDKIESGAFQSCTALTIITIPNGVTSIGRYAFNNCTNLRKATIPNSVKIVGENAFANCNPLLYKVQNGLRYMGNESNNYLCLVGYTGSIFLPINENCKVMADAIFSKTGIANITIPEGIERIGNNSFINCANLKSVVLPNSLKSIGDNAFSGCLMLNSISIPNNVTSIGRYAFSDCRKLTSITIPGGIKKIEDNTFDSCYKLSTVTIEDGVTSIGNDVFKNCEGIITLSLPSTLKSIGNNAFYECVYLTAINLPNNLESIGDNAFETCIFLESITIPSSVITIGESAFYNCSKLIVNCEATERPSGWNEDWAEGLERIVWDCKNNEVAVDGCVYTTLNNIRYSLKDGVATVIEQTTSIITAEISSNITYKSANYSVTTIGEDAFFGCAALESISLPNTIKSISDEAFYYCNSLTRVDYAGTIDEWAQILFVSVSSNPIAYSKNLYINNELVSEVVLTNIEEISDYAFYGCSSLTSITLPNSVISIGSHAFYGCNNLKYNIADGLKYLGNDQNKYLYLVGANDKNITDAIINENCRFIGDAFVDCWLLDNVTIPNGVISIGENAFNACVSLTSITIPNSVTSIGDKAFYICKLLKSIFIPKSVERVGVEVFCHCDDLTIYCEMAEAPSGWNTSWNSSNCPVVWNSQE